MDYESSSKENSFNLSSSASGSVDETQTNLTKFSSTFEPTNKRINKNKNLDFTEIALKFYEEWIGFGTFECSNIFSKFINKNFILISLNGQEREEKKKKFCFKGKCLFNLIHGNVSINGFHLNQSNQWHHLYSPETNSFTTIQNRIINNQTDFTKQSLIETILERIIDVSDVDYNNECPFNMEALNSFFDQINLQPSTSIFILGNLESQACDYISFLKNFQNVYHTKQSYNVKQSIEIDSYLANIGLYPIPINNANSLHIPTDIEIGISNELISFYDDKNVPPIIMSCGGKDVGKSTCLRFIFHFSFFKVSFYNLYKLI
jgi:hypothetical protein